MVVEVVGGRVEGGGADADTEAAVDDALVEVVVAGVGGGGNGRGGSSGRAWVAKGVPAWRGPVAYAQVFRELGEIDRVVAVAVEALHDDGELRGGHRHLGVGGCGCG